MDLSGICEGILKNENGNNIRAKGDKIMQNSALTPSWIVRIIRKLHCHHTEGTVRERTGKASLSERTNVLESLRTILRRFSR